MTTPKLIAWCLLAFAVGLLIGLWLAEHRTPPDDRHTKAARPPMASKRGVIDIFENTGKAAGQ